MQLRWKSASARLERFWRGTVIEAKAATAGMKKNLPTP
jgi:hypothetical protein